MCLSKGLTGGFLPLGATLATEELFDAFRSDDRGERYSTATRTPRIRSRARRRWRRSRCSTPRPRRAGARSSARIARPRRASHASRGVANVRVLGTILALDLDVRTPATSSDVGLELGGSRSSRACSSVRSGTPSICCRRTARPTTISPRLRRHRRVRGGAMIRLGVTGTDTGVGKTVVACAIAAGAARGAGLRVAAMKPIETGITAEIRHATARAGARRRRSDAALDAGAAHLPIRSRRWSPRARGAHVDLVALDHAMRARRTAPTRWSSGRRGTARADHRTDGVRRAVQPWKLDAVVVAANRLGVINQTRLTLPRRARPDSRSRWWCSTTVRRIGYVGRRECNDHRGARGRPRRRASVARRRRRS